jgi:hypothetical protein
VVRLTFKNFFTKHITMIPDAAPQTLSEAVSRLKDILSEEDLVYIKNMGKDEDVISLHMGLGNWIRNNFGLWGGNRSLKRDCFPDMASNPYAINTIDPDDCSHEILKALWRDLQNG